MIRLVGTGVSVFLLVSLASAQTLDTTRRARNDAREGPGNYYPLVCILPEGIRVEVLKSEGAWKEIRLGDPSVLQGLNLKDKESNLWMSKNCFAEKKGSSPLEGISVPWQSLQSSPSGVAAAIRGFALRYSKGAEKSPQTLEALDKQFFSPQEYHQFRLDSERLREGQVRIAQGGEDAPCSRPYDLTLLEEAVGLGVAAQIAERGLVDDRRRLEYINLVGTYLSEQSGAFDAPFRVFVLQGREPYAMSVPGGFIFFSQGIIDLCRDEAELAGVLAHEMMHVILGHGLKEIEKRPVQIRSDLAMAELESRTGKEPDPAKQDLERFAQEAYETIRKPRLQAYEVEADRCALILLAKAGYDPEALPSMISRVKDFLAEEGASRLSNSFLSMDFQNRYEEANRVIHSSLHNAKGVRNQDRFTANSKGTW